MIEFMNLFNEYKDKFQSLELAVRWDKYCDWTALLVHSDSNTIISDIQMSDMNRLYAQLYLDFTDWLNEVNDGY